MRTRFVAVLSRLSKALRGSGSKIQTAWRRLLLGDGFSEGTAKFQPAATDNLVFGGNGMNRLAICVLVFSLGFARLASGQSGIITTVAGNGPQGFAGDGGPAASASLNYPYGVAVDASGNLFIVDFNNYRIRKVTASGTITTVAGNGTPGYSDYTGPATAVSSSPHGVAVDASGNLFIADGYFRIRKVSASGIMTTFAGGGNEPVGFGGDGGPAISAELALPWGVALDASGILFITDSGNYRIRKVSASGIITTVAGNGVLGFSGDGGPATAASFSTLAGVAVDASGNLFIADTGNSRIRKVSASGIITTVAGNGTFNFSGDGGPAISASLYGPDGVAVDTSGNLFIADTGNSRIRKVSASGIITTVAGGGTGGLGDGGPASSASLYEPAGVAVDASGNLFIADTLNNRIREVSAATPSGSPVAIPLPAAVTDVDVNPNTNQVYVGGNIGNVVQNMVWVDGNTNSIVKSLGPGQGEHVNPATNEIYAADLYGGHILVYSGSDGSLLNSITAVGCPVEAVVDNQLNHIWGVGQCGGGNDPAFLIDGSTDTLISGYIGSGGVMGGYMAVNPSTHAFYMAVGGVEKEVNASTFAVTNAPFSASVVASSPLAASMYGADASGKNVVVINYGTESVVTTLPVSQTGAIAVNPTRNRVYAVDLSVSPPVIKVFAGGNSLSGSNTLIGSIPLRSGDHPCCSMAVNSRSGTIYLPVVNSGSPFLLVIVDTLTSPTVSTPVLTSLSPSTAVAGAGALTLTVTGSGFVSGSVVQWNGAALTTTFVGATQLTAAVPASDIASVGVAQVTVTNPGVGTSNALPFTIQASAGNLSITSLSPSSATAGGGAFTLTVNGSGFSPSLNSLQGPVPGSVVQWNGAALQTTFISSTQLTAAVPAGDLASAGTAQVSVANGASTTSNALPFTISQTVYPGPAINSLSPPSVAPYGLGTGIGVAFLPLVVNGSGFVPASVVRWNGTDHQTTFVSATQVTASIADDEIPGAPTSVPVTVFNPAPGGGTSNTFAYAVDSAALPVITSLSSPTVAAGGSGFQLTIYGWNFNSGTVARWNGSDRPTTPFFDPHGQCCVLYAAIAASDIAAAGTAQVTVFTAGAGSSNPLSFTIQAPQTTGPTITVVSNAATHTPGVIAPNSWVEIKGSNLAPAGDSRIWQGSDFVNNRMPTQLDGVGVTMNGENAYMYYASPAQVNVLTPPDLASGPVQVKVATGGATSAAFTAQAQQYLPSFFMFGPGPYVLGTHANGSDLGPTSLYPGLTTPAAPGELVILYATGFGPISPPVVAGSEVQSGSLPVLPLVQIGGISASVLFAGLVSPGLYQFNVFVPASAPNGDNTLTAQYAGFATQSGVLLTVQNQNSGVNPTLTITKSGTGSGTVGSSPAGTSCGSGCLSFAAGTVVTLTPTPTAGSTFAGWSGACSGAGSCTVTMNSNLSVTAAFNLTATVNPTLNITTTGTGSGTVSASPTGTSCGSGCLSFAAGTAVTLTATPNTGSTFAGWSGACSGTGGCSVTMNSNLSVTATFNLTPQTFTLTVGYAGTGTGGVSASPPGPTYASGTVVTLSASPGSGSTFAGWSGACSGTGSCTVTMNSNMAVTATFNLTLQQFTLTVAHAGTGSGAVSANPSGPTYASGTVVSLTASPSSGSTFAGWSGACSGTGGCSVTMNSNLSVTATFNLTPQTFTLTVGYAGTGTGGVSASPPGPTYASGTVVTLSASPGSGSTFAGWSGACSGTGSCTVTMNSNLSVTATFNLTSGGGGNLTGTWSGTVTENAGGCPFAGTMSWNLTETGTNLTGTTTYNETIQSTDPQVVDVCGSTASGTDTMQGSANGNAVNLTGAVGETFSATVNGTTITGTSLYTGPNYNITWSYTLTKQ